MLLAPAVCETSGWGRIRLHTRREGDLSLRDGSRVIVETPDDLFKIGLTSIDLVGLGLGALIQAGKATGYQ